jgi:hypothetical protein
VASTASPTALASASPRASEAVPASPTALASASPRASEAVPASQTAPTDASPLTYSDDEQWLLEAIREDARVACVPERGDIQPRAIAAVGCRLETPLVHHISAFLVPPQVDADGTKTDLALQTYLELLTSYGVQPRTGDCQAGTSGDSSWPDYLPDVSSPDEEGPYRPSRSGCFLDQNGIANVAVTCYAGISIWIYGGNDDLAGLYAWAWRLAEGESPDRDPPGICAFPD